MSNGEELKKRLFDLGHFRNPEMPTEVDTLEELASVSLTSKDMKTAIRSYQDFMRSDFERLCLEEHGRAGVADGDVGPATRRLFDVPRCGFPDFDGPPGVLQSRQEANWPTACRGNLVFGLAFDKAPGMSSEDTLRAFIGAINNWNYALRDLSAKAKRGKDNANIWAGLGRLGGSTLAWSYLAQNSCRSKLEQRYDSGRNWNLNFLSTVASHELGHAYGLPHNRDGSALMYPSIHSRSLGRRGYPNSTDLSQARGLGYTLSGSQPPTLEDQYRPMPHDPTDPDDPDDPPPPGDISITGDFKITVNGESQDFVLAPKIQV